MQELRDAGYLPEAVDNYIALLGAGFASDEEYFTLARAGASASAWSASRRTRRSSTSRSCATSTVCALRELGIDELTGRLEDVHRPHGLRGAVEISAEKIQTLADFWPLVAFLFDGPADDPAAFDKTIGATAGWRRCGRRATRWPAPSRSRVENVEAALRGVVERRGPSPGRCSSRCASRSPVTTVSPGIFESVALLGRDETLARIDRALPERRAVRTKIASDTLTGTRHADNRARARSSGIVPNDPVPTRPNREPTVASLASAEDNRAN